MDENILTDDPNGTKPTDIIGDGSAPDDAGLALGLDADGPASGADAAAPLAETLAQPAASPPRDPGAVPAQSIRPLRLSDVRAYVKDHPRAIAALAIVGLIVLAALGLAWRHTSNLPSLELIERDARDRIAAPTYSGGYFGDDDRLILTQVTVGARQHSKRAPEGAELDETFGAMGYVTADVMLTYQNGSVIATKTATLGYAKQNEAWVDAGIVANEQVSYVATAGVSQRKVLKNMGQILERASSVSPAEDGAASLATIYEDAQFEVVGSFFDEAAQTHTLNIHARKGRLFSAYECDIVATFAFRQGNGLWELVEATVTDDAWTRRFDPLVGTWNGLFKSQEVSGGAKCLAAGSTPFVLTITSWETAGTGARIQGTVTGIAHYHRNPDKDQSSTEGDALLDEVPFTATLLDAGDVQLASEAVFTATLPEAVGGKVSITLEFGTGDDGAGVTATVTTEHQFEDMFILIPYQNQVIYADRYELMRAPDEQDPADEDGADAGQDTQELGGDSAEEGGSAGAESASAGTATQP